MSKQKGRTPPPPSPQEPQPSAEPTTVDELIATLESEDTPLQRQQEQIMADANREIGRLQGIRDANKQTIARLKGLSPPAPTSPPEVTPPEPSDPAA